MAAQTKTELVDELGSHASKADLVKLLGSHTKKDELASLLEDDGDATKEQLLRKLGSRTKDELVELVGSRLTKDDVQRYLDRRNAEQEREQANREDDDSDDGDDDGDSNSNHNRDRNEVARRHVDDADIDWSAELDWAPPPQPTPAPVNFTGAAPFMPGQRVRVDLAGLPMMGIFAGKGASAAGTIVGVDARARMVRVYLDAVFDGEKELSVPPERITPDG